MRVIRTLAGPATLALSALLAACGGGGSGSAASPQAQLATSVADTAQVTADAPVAGATPFIAFFTLHGAALQSVASVRFVVVPQAGTVSKPVSVTYSMANLLRRGYATAGGDTLKVPVFGLYAGATNAVNVVLSWSDGSTSALPLTVATAAWTDPQQIYDRPTIVKARDAATPLGFDFFYMKSAWGSPVVVDTDGRVRWVGPAVLETIASDYDNAGGFLLGGFDDASVWRIDFDGTYAQTGSLASAGVASIYHDIEAGKTGFLGNMDGTFGGVYQVESTAEEFSADGTTIAVWDLARILSDLMTAGGDDPTLFVRPGTDWFHMNTAVYDAADDSLIVSSRENFVIKLDYATGAVRWIMGDPSKYWYTFPSLRAKALAWAGDGLVPIGQHSATIAPDGSLMVFNNGYESLNQPAGAPAGQSRAYSAVSDYVIDETARTVTEAWHFDYGQSVSSLVCSSARSTSDGSVLVDYAVAEGLTAARLVGLQPTHAVAFDFRYATSGCNTSWNAQPIALESLALD